MRAHTGINDSQRLMLGKRSHTVFVQQTITAIVLLCLTFVVSLRVNGQLNRIPTPMLLFLLIPNFFILRLKISTVVAYLVFVILTMLHLVWLDGSGRIPFSILDVLKDYTLYIGLIGLYIMFFSTLTWDILDKPAIVFFKALTLIGLGLWMVAMVVGSSFGVDVTYPIPRLQSLVTEPSNTSHFLPALLIYSLWQRLWGWSAICVLAILCTFSPTVYLTFIVTITLLWLLNARPLSILVVVSLGTVAVILIFSNYVELIAAFNESGQLGMAAARILEGINFITSDGQAGANSRAGLIFAWVDFMGTHSLWWSGTGFGTSAYIGNTFNNGLLFDSNTWASLVTWFGVLVAPVWLLVQYLAVRNPERSFLYILLVSVCVSNTLNAGGVWFQMFFATLMYLKFKQKFSESIS